jgi:hypothetical protein
MNLIQGELQWLDLVDTILHLPDQCQERPDQMSDSTFHKKTTHLRLGYVECKGGLVIDHLIYFYDINLVQILVKEIMLAYYDVYIWF